MIELHDIRYVRLGTRDLAAADEYAQKILGLEVARTEAGTSYYRSDDRDHTLVYFAGDPQNHVVGFELRTADELDHAASHLSNAGIDVHAGSAEECERRHVKAFVNFRDPSGNSIDLVARPHHSGRRYFPSRDAGITGFSHVGLCTTNAVRDEKFWTEILGARVSDRIGDAPLLRIDEVHHKVALFPALKPGVQHINHQVETVDDVMRAWYLLKRNGVRVVFGPGRHPTSGAIFLYFEGPDGMVYEYSTGVRHITAGAEPFYQPRQFPRINSSFCMWGSEPDIAEFRT
ncbi:VOC family protein [Trinickia symbiotica]|uniref:Glyoxalase/bleomycin resistance/extradiol dioxygenase family protein n=1 Tax=Trinickia symbiotica TaxID=863227 RepID=A0A2N7XAF2_9BURK|nr:VOC family protein [Trinickia symbiotica]PMS38591.1 glyoxalase/bleomycin resistance/extradiol dioxygenase family protein [Trinickia symbiotica]